MGCSQSEGPRIEGAEGAPVILISIDTLRSDHLPAYGYEEVETPHLDAFARDAITFDRAYSHTPLTLPSHASILSGKLPDEHGVRDNIGYDVPADLVTFLPRDLAAHGYRTGGAVSAYVLRGETGIGNGFEFFEDDIPFREGVAGGAMSRRGDETLEAARDWLHSVADERFFFFFHLYEPHLPWEAPEPFATRFASPYDAEVAAADAVVGELMAELVDLGIYDDAIIVVLSDHGEGLGDHGYVEHGFLLYREDIQVPLFLKLPGQQLGGTRQAADAQLVDLYPTIAELVGLRLDDSLPGCSLLRLPECAGPDRAIYSESFYARLHLGWSDQASLVQGDYHFIDGPDPELYDLGKDPRETTNILRDERRVYGEMRGKLEGFNRQLEPPMEVDEETRDRLAALGYLGSSQSDLEGPLPDPKGQLHTLEDLNQARAYLEGGEYEVAAEAARRAVTANPRMVDAWDVLGNALEQQAKLEEAVQAYKKAMEISGPRSEIILAISRVQLELGHVEEALAGIEMARQAGVINPNSLRRTALLLAEWDRLDEALDLVEEAAEDGTAESMAALGRVLSEQGRQEDAIRELDRALSVDPANARANEYLGLVYLRLGDSDLARQYSAMAVELDPTLADAWNNLGAALYFLERPEEALGAWEEAVAQDPSQYETLFNIGIKAPELGRLEQARFALRRFIETAPQRRYAADIEEARRILRQLGG
jgi:arylsulfatase A-like enzyme/Tfp pilus assembly protein PilF